jgi:hypothetical protein
MKKKKALNISLNEEIMGGGSRRVAALMSAH